jgi:ribosomal protein L21E
MRERTPDNWIILKLPENKGYKVLAGWSGGYLDGDSWQLNSGVERWVDDGDYYEFHGYSGSVYRCHKDCEGVRMNITGMLDKLVRDYNFKQVDVGEMINGS